MGPIAGQISTDVKTPAGAYASAQMLCRTAVSMQREVSGTIEASIDILSRRGQFGSWLLKLWKNHNASIHLDRYERLVEIVEEMAEERRRQADHIKHMINASRGKRFAANGGGSESDDSSGGPDNLSGDVCA